MFGIFWHHISVIIFSLLLLWTVFHFINILIKRREERLIKEGQETVARALPLFTKIIKILLTVPVLLFILQNLGVDIGALLAGLGVGGLVVALAGQKTVENLFGGVMLLLDEPIKVGEYCKFNGTEGVVEYIGLRSTRIRTRSGTLLTIPNGEFSQCKIENFTKREFLLLSFTVKIHSYTPKESIKTALDSIGNFMQKLPYIIKEKEISITPSFAEHGINIDILSYVNPIKGTDLIMLKEDIFCEIMTILEKQNIRLYSPQDKD